MVGFLLILDLRIGMAATGWIGTGMLVSCSVLLVPYCLVCLYIFPVLAKFENTIWDNLKNALLMSWQSFGYSLILVLISLTFLMLALCFPPFVGMLLICGAGFYGYITALVFVQIFRRYLPQELQQDLESSGRPFDRF